MKVNRKLFSKKWWILPVLIAVITTFYILQPTWGKEMLSLFSTNSIDRLASFVRSFGWWGPLISIGLMILQAVAAPLPSFLLAAANGIVFGIFWGSVISWVGGMAGLSQIRIMAFLIATGIGQIPGTILYVMVGHDLTHMHMYEKRLIFISVVLVILMILGKWWMSRKQKP
jgi:uncharacterized membrane protein YdjX (TVP38/TMEM64 family)